MIEPNSVPTNILIVDDKPENLKVLMSMLAHRGYQVRPALSGRLALTAVQENPPDLILLDINMPEMDGYEVCRRLKESRPGSEIPIIFISALNETDDKVRAFQAGGVDYITKPFQIEEVLARVQSHLALRALQRELRQKNTALARSNAALQASNRELDAFAHTVAHDLKNPLAVIVAYASYLSGAWSRIEADKVLKHLRTIERGGRTAGNIIDELMLLAGVRKQQVTVKPLDMASILDRAHRRLHLMIEEYEGRLTLPDRWPPALGYGPWVEEVWINYLSNGLKYGGRPPRLDLGATPQADGTVCFWVRDNGSGIDPEAQPRLFTEFTRLDELKAEGHGLGLSIVRRIIEKLGGRVGLESEVGRGSTFYFTLPGQT